MDPSVIARPVLAIVIALLTLCLVMLPFYSTDTIEFAIVLIAVIVNAIFLAAVMIWIRKKAG